MDPDDTETAAEGGIQMEYSSDWPCSNSIGAVTKKLPVKPQPTVGTV